jgi:SAM-dependent MidA family methyltransferase
VEAGAGNGRLARDVLDATERHHPEFCRAVRLHLVERSPQARAAQAAVLGRHSSVCASSSPDLPGAVAGVIYANELLDALPPHLVVMRAQGLREVYVDAADGRLVTREGPPSSPRIAEYLAAVGARLEPGWFAEVNLAAADWIGRAGRCLERGFLVIIDYAHDAAVLYSASHATGTLTTYRGHAAERREDGPGWLLEPGDRDITSHVDLTGIALAGRDAGLRLVGVVDQAYFLLGLGLAERLAESDGGSRRALARRLALKTLVLPGGLGSTLKVMVFAKSVDGPPLRGLSFGGRVT